MARFNIGQWAKDEAARCAAQRVENARIEAIEIDIGGVDLEEGKLEDYPCRKLKEVSFYGETDALREIAKFLLECADDIDAKGFDFGHAHWRGGTAPDVIVIGPQED